jgi:hypothetical protein
MATFIIRPSCCSFGLEVSCVSGTNNDPDSKETASFDMAVMRQMHGSSAHVPRVATLPREYLGDMADLTSGSTDLAFLS